MDMQSGQIEGFRLSPQQKRTWLLQQEDATGSYCIQGAVLITGQLKVEALQEALQTIVDRYEIFRTTFQCLPGMTLPLQVIRDGYHVDIHQHALIDLSPQAQEAKFEEFFEQLKQQSFTSESTPPFLIQLLKLEPQKHVLLIRLSPLLADGITLRQLVSEINALYSSARLHERTDETDVMQYADIAEWQNELLEQEAYSLGQDYWQKQRASSNHDLVFLTGNTHRQPSEFPIELVPTHISSNLATKLSTLAHRLEVSIPVLLLSCWQILLWRVIGRQDLTVSISGDGRGHEELVTAPGPLSKYLPLSCHLDNKLPFEAFLRQVNQAVNAAYEWQDDFTWEERAIENSLFSGSPFGFEFESWSDSYGETGVSFSLHSRFVWREKFQLQLFCLQKGDNLTAEFYYDARLYGSKKVKELSAWFLTLLESAVNAPATVVGKLQLIDDDQKNTILKGFNQTQAAYRPVQCIHRLFEGQAQKTPDHIAVVFEGQQLTYAELNAKANQLAHYLQRLGIGSEGLVGIYLERSIDMIVSLLAIMKAGGAYIPLDPALPQESLLFRLQDTQASILLSQLHLLEELPNVETRLVYLDQHQEAIAQERQDDPDSDIPVESLAYVLFTSGSTGKPKGVAVEHRQLFNYSRAIADKLDLSSCKSFATVSTFAADLGNTAIFPALLSGGCLHIISAERASNPETLADYFDHHAIDCLKIVPSHLAALLTSSRPEQILPKQRLILGGEACDWQLIEKIYGYGSSCQIFNHYGPTETTVGALTYAIDAERLAHRSPQQKTVPIGRPIANAQVYLLDADGQPVPRGVPGEIYIGGAGVARGYLNRTQLTTERFIPNPFIGHPLPDAYQSPVLYKTGDLGCYQPDGTVEFLGRIDYQVKIRGYRIELGEIESAIRQHPAVRDTVVLAREGQSGNRRLVAYIVPEKQSDLVVSELRESLQTMLADYMVPAVFVLLKTLPLTPNGKLDRQALPAPESVQIERQATFVAPGTEAEKTLAEIWAKTLGIEKIGIHDNFFELGGDSILSIQIVARATQAGLKLTPKQVFENQTIAELASVATTQQMVQAEQGPVVGDVPLTPIQHWFFEKQLPEIHHWNQSILLEVKQPLNIEQLEQAVQRLLEHHDALRLRFVHEINWQQHSVAPDDIAPFKHVDLSKAVDPTLALSSTAAELQASLDLTSGPLMRVVYFDLGPDQSNRLLLIIHHLAVDGISWRILLEDLQIAHQQVSQGNAILFPPKTTSFKYWAEQLTDYAKSDRLQQEQDYWLKQSSSVRLPVDFSSHDNAVEKAHTVSVALSEAETVALLQEVPAAYRTQINDVLLTALVQAFAHWTGERSLLLDLEGHGREDLFENVDISRTVGWFTTIFPILLDIQQVSDAQLGDVLKAVKEQLRAVPNRGIGYGILRYLCDRTDWQPQPAEVRFNYLGQTDQILQSSSIFAPAQEAVGPGRSPQGNRSYRLDINSVIAAGQLKVDWSYSEAIHRRATVETLAQQFIESLRSLIAHCQNPDAGGFTPSDFSEANLNQQELDQFLAKLNGIS